ncbi:RING finger domain-containing protein [Spironucleus salmonicida]|uniref:RING finger domain-containing protein n=1 Tax=Spironucleus salmonicida TaxID=348837 RepID=V6LPA5_9EUKA|nr:RING finger domain-containing protein [Spironucleus salmonicida]|eukprot:EST45546.1 RING finger domain-containing protein [Spironucleus salmonicida]
MSSEIKRAEFDYLQARFCYEKSFQQYEKEINELKDELNNQHDLLSDQENKYLSQHDKLENNLENIGWITTLMLLQSQLLSTTIKQPIEHNFDLSWIKIITTVQSTDNTSFQDFKNKINNIISQFNQFKEKFEESESQSLTDEKQISQSLFTYFISQEALLKQSYIDFVYQQQILEIQSNILCLFKDDWSRRLKQGQCLQSVAREKLQQLTITNGELQGQIKILNEKIISIQSNKQLDLKLVIQSLNDLQLPEKEENINFYIPQNIQEVQDIQINIQEPQKNLLTTIPQITALQDNINVIQSLDFHVPLKATKTINEEELHLFNNTVSVSITQYENLLHQLENGLSDDNIACDALEETSVFIIPKISIPPPKFIPSGKPIALTFDTSLLQKFDDKLAIALDEIQRLQKVFNCNNQELISQQVQSQHSLVSKSLESLISKLQKAVDQVNQEILTQNTQYNEINAQIQQKRQDLTQINTVQHSNQSQIFILQKQNFCQICKTTPLGIILPCGHCFCDRCLKDLTGRNCKCPVCRFMYKENEVVKMRKGLNFK